MKKIYGAVRRFFTIAPALAAMAICLLTFQCVSPGGGGGLLVNSTTAPLIITENPVGKKTGRSSAFCFLGAICLGDAGTYRAARNGDITKIATVDYHYTSFLYFVYNSTTIIVSGE